MHTHESYCISCVSRFKKKKKKKKTDLPTLPIFRPKGQTNIFFLGLIYFIYVMTTIPNRPVSQIYKGEPRPGIPTRVMASSAMGVKLRVFRFFADHTHHNKNKRKTNVPTIFAHCVAFQRVFIFKLRQQ